MAVAKLLQQCERFAFILCLLFEAEWRSRWKAAAIFVPHTRHKLLNVPV